jgi:hypothetical protein
VAEETAALRQLALVQIAQQRGLRSALEKVGKQALTQTRRQLSSQVGLMPSRLDPFVTLRVPSIDELSSAVRVKPHTFNIASFAGTRQLKRGRVTAQTIYVKGGRRRVVSERGSGGVVSNAWGHSRLYPHVFLIDAPRR